MNFINPVIVSLGNFEIRWYGVLIMAGVAMGAWFAARLRQEARARLRPHLERAHRGRDHGHPRRPPIPRLFNTIRLPARRGLCLWLPYYRHHFLEAFAIWKSGGFQGLGIYGAILGGILGVTGYALAKHLNRWSDWTLGPWAWPLDSSWAVGATLSTRNCTTAHRFLLVWLQAQPRTAPPASARWPLRPALPPHLPLRIAVVPGRLFAALHALVSMA